MNFQKLKRPPKFKMYNACKYCVFPLWSTNQDDNWEMWLSPKIGNMIQTTPLISWFHCRMTNWCNERFERFVNVSSENVQESWANLQEGEVKEKCFPLNFKNTLLIYWKQLNLWEENSNVCFWRKVIYFHFREGRQ